MKKMILLIFLFSCSSLFSQKQTIVQAEYFTDINTRPGMGNSIFLIDSVQTSVDIPWDSIPPILPGSLYYIRVKSSGFNDSKGNFIAGKWSIPVSVFYSANGKIVAVEANISRNGNILQNFTLKLVDGKFDQPIELFKITTKCDDVKIGDSINIRIKSNLGFWSNWYSIIINEDYLKPIAPSNLSLKLNEENQKNIELTWSPSPTGAVKYLIERKVDNNDFIVYDSINVPQIYYKDTRIEDGKKYSYRIKALSYQTCLNSDYSNISSVTVVSVEEFNQTSNDILIYPNPTTNSFHICYFLPEDQYISLSMSTLLGQELSTLIKNSFQQKGWHNCQIDCSEQLSGIYIINLRINNKTLTKTMGIIH